MSASGLSQAAIECAAEVYAHAKNVIVCYGMGVTQHALGMSNAQQITNLLMLRETSAAKTPELLRFAVIPPSRATGQSASPRSQARHSSKAWNGLSVSSPTRTRDTTR